MWSKIILLSSALRTVGCISKTEPNVQSRHKAFSMVVICSRAFSSPEVKNKVMGSRSISPVRTSRGQQSPGSNRHDSFSDSSPKKSRKRSASSSPDPKLKKSKKSKKEISVTPSPSRQNQQIQDSDSGSLSSTPPPKKKKKKPKQRGHSSSQSPQASDEYDARQYQKSQDGRGDGRKIRPAKNKNKTNYDGNDGYSSDDN